MKTLKLLLVAVLMTGSTVAFANSVNPEKKDRSVSKEIQRMLLKSDLIIEDDLLVTVVFSLSEDKRIVIRAIKSEDESIASFLTERLDQKKVYGSSWDLDKIYEVPVRIQSVR